MTALEKTKILEALASKLTTQNTIALFFILEEKFGEDIIHELINFITEHDPVLLQAAWPEGVPRFAKVVDYRDVQFTTRTFL